MIIYDPLYGKFELPRAAQAVVQTPEFRRLSQIRLLNTISPTLATLGEIRRYSHTLGVVYLESLWERCSGANFLQEEFDALQASIILHDIGTPPFGHLFEYILKERNGWNHEAVIVDILKGRHAPENIAHQIFASQTLKVIKALEKAGVDIDIVINILECRHPLSKLILGRLDFDNLDNVARMALALGVPGGENIACSLAKNLVVTTEGVVACSKRHHDLVVDWMRLRRKVYEIVVFDMQTVAAQAVLTRAITLALESNLLSAGDWSLTDEQLLDRLQSSSLTKGLINLQYLGVLPQHIVTLQINKQIKDLGFSTRQKLIMEIENYAYDLGIKHPIAYIFQDTGTFEKSFRFIDPDDNAEWCIGEMSMSTIIYLFNKSGTEMSLRRKERIVRKLIAMLGISDSNIIKTFFGDGFKNIDGQQLLHF